MQKGTPRKYSEDERSEAIRLAGEIGLTEAASKLDIPVPTVSHWLRLGRVSGIVASSNVKARKYAASEKSEGVRLAGELGVAAAAAQLGMPMTTLHLWVRKQRQLAKASVRRPRQSASADDERAAEESVAASSWTQPAVQAATRPAGQAATQPAVQAATRPAVQAATQPAVQAATQPAVQAATQPAVQAATQPAVQPEHRPAKTYTPSERARALEFAAREGITAAAIKYGISRFSIYEWQRRTRLHAEGKASSSPVIGSDEDHAAARDHRILSEWKKHPGLGPSQVRNQLRRQGFKVSVHTVRCVMEENGYVTPKVRRTAIHDRRYEAARPNQMWHLDFLHRHVNKQKIYVLLILDDYSRFIVGASVWDGERASAVEETFLTAVNRHGAPKSAMSDGGSAFYSWRGIGAFTRLLDELEIDQLIAEIPEINGKLEALNANIQKELFDERKFFDLAEAQRHLLHWVQGYNLRRTHHALGGLLVPADRYFGRVDDILAAIESGRSPDGIGEPVAPGERQLDLFRITSQRGRVEVYLLGHRILLREVQ